MRRQKSMTCYNFTATEVTDPKAVWQEVILLYECFLGKVSESEKYQQEFYSNFGCPFCQTCD